MASIGTRILAFANNIGTMLVLVMVEDALGLLVGSTVCDMEKGETILIVVAIFLAFVGLRRLQMKSERLK